jgi:hypothetical protein
VLVKLNTPYKLCGCQCMVLCTAQFTDSIVKHLLLCQVQRQTFVLCMYYHSTAWNLQSLRREATLLHYYLFNSFTSNSVFFFECYIYFALTLVKPCGCCTGRSSGHQQSSRRGLNVLQWRWGWADILHLYLRALIMLFKEVDNSTTNLAPPESQLVGCLALLAWHPFSGGWNLQPPKYSHYAKPSKPKDPSWPYYACKHS